MAASEWAVLFRNCLHRRLSSDDVKHLSTTFKERNSILPKKIVKIIIQCHRSFCVASDPLPSNYLVAITVSNLVTISDIISVLANELGSLPEIISDPDATPSDLATWTLASNIAQDLIAVICEGKVETLDAQEVWRSLSCLSNCITTALVAATRLTTSSQSGEKTSQAVLFTVESAGNLLCAIVGSGAGIESLTDSNEKEKRAAVLRTVHNLLGSPVPLSLLLRARLEEVQKHFALYDTDTSKAADEAMLGTVPPEPLQVAASVPSTLPPHSRATLFVYLNAALCGRPMFDDNVLISFLNARYGEDHVSLFIGLALAAFDVLANGHRRKETAQAKALYQSCLLNKVPLLLSDITGPTMSPSIAELCITQILNRLNPDIFPFSSGPDDTGAEKTPWSGMRQEFVFACVLHKLIPEDSITKLLGEDAARSHPFRVLLSKQDIMQQTLSGTREVEMLIDDILPMEGNSGIAVQALVEVILHLCQAKDTGTLKSVCSHLVRKPEVLDIIFLFKAPSLVLNPLCTLLEEWKWGEVQSEKEPLYFEFGSILLLILTAKYRFDLEAAEMGILKTDSFLFRLLYLGTYVKRLDSLSESENTYLGSWITALFKDEGLTDELLSSCSPQDFYLLIPTLFSQSLDACRAGKLAFDTMKAGFDYLLEPFLLPSLVVALSWLKRHILELNAEHSNALKILHGLVNPTNISPECRSQHQTIVSMMALPMAEQLQNVLKRHPSLTQAKQILLVLQPHVSFGRKNIVSRNELQTWTSPDILKTLQSQLCGLLSWSTAIEASTQIPPRFTFNLFNMATQLCGAHQVFKTLFTFLTAYLNDGKLEAALDLVLSIICSPSQSLGRHNLLDALKVAYSNLPRMLDKQPIIVAELLVRLHNLVEAHRPLPLPQQAALDATAVNLNLDDMDLNMATSTALESAVGGVQAPHDGAVENIDDMLDVAEGFDIGGMGSLGGDGLDDVFGGDGDGGDMDLSAADLDFDLDKIF